MSNVMFYACTESTPDLSDVVIFVSTQNNDTIINSGDKVLFSIQMSTIHQNIERFKISSFDNQYGNLILLDSICCNKDIEYSYVYTAPETNRDSLKINLFFEVWDNKGHTQKINRILQLKNNYITIPELTGISIFASVEGMPNAISLLDLSQPFELETSPDSLSADIYFEIDTKKHLFWKSKTELKFVKSNSFNYVSATANNINIVYQSSVKREQIDNININDIILVGHNYTAHGVFQIRNIIEYGNGFCLQLSFKGIKHSSTS